MNKTDLECLADIRIAEAKTLLDAGCFQGAYYLAGYSLECAIKACIAKQVKEFDFPCKDLAHKSHQHNLYDLLGAAGLKQRLTERERQDLEFKLNWAVAKDWNVESRYDSKIAQSKAKDLFNAVTHKDSGILAWLKTLW